jgi:hypothetical protein
VSGGRLEHTVHGGTIVAPGVGEKQFGQTVLSLRRDWQVTQGLGLFGTDAAFFFTRARRFFFSRLLLSQPLAYILWQRSQAKYKR